MTTGKKIHETATITDLNMDFIETPYLSAPVGVAGYSFGRNVKLH